MKSMTWFCYRISVITSSLAAHSHGPRVVRIKQDCCSLNQTTKAINSYTPVLLCHKIFDPASVVSNKCNIFYLSGLMQTPNTTLCLPHLHFWRIFLGRHLIKDFWRASDLITRHPQLHPVIARLQNPSCNQCNLMIRLHDDTVDRILDGDEEGDVVLHANPPKPVLWVRSSCLSGALNGPDWEQLQRTSMCLTSNCTVHLQRASRTLGTAGVVIYSLPPRCFQT